MKEIRRHKRWQVVSAVVFAISLVLLAAGFTYLMLRTVSQEPPESPETPDLLQVHPDPPDASGQPELLQKPSRPVAESLRDLRPQPGSVPAARRALGVFQPGAV